MLSSVANAFKYLGKAFKDLYESFKSMFGSAFRLPKISLKVVSQGFQNAVNKVKDSVGRLTHSKTTAALETSTTVDAGAKDKWMAFGGYASVKLGEKLVGKVVDFFCDIAKVIQVPIKNAFNNVVKLITGIIPVWLLKIAMFGGVGALISTFLFSAFTVGWGWGYTYGISTDSYEIGLALELNKATLQIGRTGCYLGGSSGLTQGSLGVSTGFVVGAFKKFGNIAGDSATIGI